MNLQISMSDNVNEIFGALAKAQGKIQPASKDKSNPFFKSKYADLSSVWDACREALSENGLSVIQIPQTKPEGTFLISILGHSSGQWIRGDVLVPLAKNDPQSVGSALTYFRRYCLSSLVGVAPEDDDGEKAQSSFRSQKTQPIISKISLEQAFELQSIIEDCDVPYKDWVHSNIKKKYGVEKISELPLEAFQSTKDAAIKRMDEYRSKQLQEVQ